MFDPMKPHKRIVAKGCPIILIQNGLAYEFGSLKPMGKIAIIQDRLAGKSGNIVCPHCGGTFPKKEAYEKHLFKAHRDILVSAASKRAPKNIEGDWAPSEAMLREEAEKISGGASTASGDTGEEPNKLSTQTTAPAAPQMPKPAPAKKGFREKA
jgi:uncharacterized C2H2 Zn-finger protein